MYKPTHTRYQNHAFSPSKITKYFFSSFIAAYILVLLPLSAKASQEASTIFSLIDKRLSYMKDVAAYKALNHEAIEDIAREAVVLEKSKVQAEKLGLDPSSVMHFFEAQINAAKAIQYRYRADWLSVPLPSNYQPSDLKAEIRPALIELGNEILITVQRYLSSGKTFSRTALNEFINSISTTQLTEADKRQLYEGLSEIRLKKDEQAVRKKG